MATSTTFALLLRPTCDFVLVTRNGGQHNKPGELMSKLVFDARGKYVHATCYGQIVETASCSQLSSSLQSTIPRTRNIALL